MLITHAMKTIIIGFDAFDPNTVERLSDKGRLPNLQRLMNSGGYSRLQIANPAQSEVSWTSIATGLGPAGHGLYDFVHRNPATYGIHISMLPTKKDLFGTRFVNAHNSKTLFDQAAAEGYPATSLWWPVTFPARQGSSVHTIPGLGTPDIHGRLGVGTFYGIEAAEGTDDYKSNIVSLKPSDKGIFRSTIRGPAQRGDRVPRIEFELEVHDDRRSTLKIAGSQYELTSSTWSEVITLVFRMKLGFKAHAITRAIMADGFEYPGLYFLPLQIHPHHSNWPYAHPPNFVKRLWKSHGPFLTLGWPQDTTALDEGLLSDEQFILLCESVFQSRRSVFLSEVEQFGEGVLACVFDSLDRLQHMFLRDRPELIDEWYRKHDLLLGEILDILESKKQRDIRLLVLSDHGFTRFDYKVHLNTWLIEQDLLKPKDKEGISGMANIDWSKSQAYAIGLSSLYLNLEGREREGAVKPQERDKLIRQIQARLLDWIGPTGDHVVSNAWPAEKLQDWQASKYAPDLILGYSRGYRGSAATGLGQWKSSTTEANADHWGADHCVDPSFVPGVIFSNHKLEIESPSYEHIPSMALGSPFERSGTAETIMPDEDQEALEKRLRDLGYL